MLRAQAGTQPKQQAQGFSVSRLIKYEDLKLGIELGRGSFGVVYQGRWLNRDVAVKQLLVKNLSDESKQEFESEAHIMANSPAPNIVQLYGYCVTPERCLVMEYMPKRSLYGVLHSSQPLEWPIKIKIAMDMAAGVCILHTENVIHRDIKSLNVLLDENFKAKLTDFGLAKVKHESQSISSHRGPAGTPAWMAPELFSEEGGCTKASDIYSLGITFWELASRERPFKKIAHPAVIPDKVNKGYRDDIPADCPTKLETLIRACWDTKPQNRPDAESVDMYFKSNFNDFTLFQKSRNQALSSGLSNAPSSQPMSLAPTSAAIIPVHVPAELQAQVNQLLFHVACGEQDEAEALLKQTPALALYSSDVTDLSGRTFKGITAFQYAVWALDSHMWTMIMKYWPKNKIDKLQEQAQGLQTGAWVKQHGASASWQNLLDALQEYIDLCNKSQWDEAATQWNKGVGSAQRLLPAHVVNEYCHPDRPFDPCPDFSTGALPRSRKINEGEWFTANYQGGVLGDYSGAERGDLDRVIARSSGRHCVGALLFANPSIQHRHCSDLIASHTLMDIRAQQRDQLLANLLLSSGLSNASSLQPMSLSLTPSAIIPVHVPVASQVQVNQLLFHVACGEQDEAEALLKETPALVLSPSDVTDLSGRIFKNITAFQYAVWALDSHMWTMIMKCWPKDKIDKIQEQAQGLETGAWVKEHGSSASWQNLLDALQEYIDLCDKYQWCKAATQWNKGIGGAQRLLPAHVVNEYCHPDRGFDPCPDFRTGTLPRLRKTEKGEWFTAKYNGGGLGESFSCYRWMWPLGAKAEGEWGSTIGGRLAGAGAHTRQAGADRVSLHVLMDTRAQQRHQLVAELLRHPQAYKAGR